LYFREDHLVDQVTIRLADPKNRLNLKIAFRDP